MKTVQKENKNERIYREHRCTHCGTSRGKKYDTGTAEKLSISDKAVSKWENEGSLPDISILVPLSDIFDVTVDYLLRGTPKTVQQIICGVPHAPIARINGKPMITGLNEDYLAKGWRVVSSSVTPVCDQPEYIFVIER